MKYDLKILHKNVEAAYGKEMADTISDSLFSLGDRQFQIKFHFENYNNLLKRFYPKEMGEFDALKLMFTDDPKLKHDLIYAMKGVEALALACLQSLHSMADILAHVVYFAINGPSSKSTEMKESAISAKSVIKKLEKVQKFPDLIKMMSRLIDHDDFQYLESVVNRSKHGCVVKAAYSIRISDGELPHGVEIKSFAHNGKSYSNTWFEPFIEREYLRQTNLVAEIFEWLCNFTKKLA